MCSAVLKLTHQIHSEICNSLSESTFEKGIVLGLSEDGIVRNLYHDTTATSTEKSYTPDVKAVNEVLKKWYEDKVIMCGIVHSHTKENHFPSCADINYAISILKALDTTKEFFIPIYYNSLNENKKGLYGYCVWFSESGKPCFGECKIEIIDQQGPEEVKK